MKKSGTPFGVPDFYSAAVLVLVLGLVLILVFVLSLVLVLVLFVIHSCFPPS